MFSDRVKKDTQKVLDEFKAIFEEDGGGDADERMRLLSLFLENGSHLTMNGLEELVRKKRLGFEAGDPQIIHYDLCQLRYHLSGTPGRRDGAL